MDRNMSANCRLFHRRFSIHLFIPNQSFNGFDVIVIFKHHLMDFKDGRLLFADLSDGRIIEISQLFQSRFSGFLKALYFLFDAFDFMDRCRYRIAMEKGQWSDRDTAKDAFPH